MQEFLLQAEPDIDSLAQNKARLILMNKSDLVDPKANQEWETYFMNKGYQVVTL